MTVNPLPLLEQLDGLDYPVSREDLIRRAQEIGAGTAVLQMLRSLPMDHFDSSVEVTDAVTELG